MDQAEIKQFVENYQRAFISAMQSGGLQAGTYVSERFEALIKQTADRLPPIESASFLQMVEAERELVLAEYTTNPVAFKNRLGIPLGVDAPRQKTYQRQGIGEMAVRTAVRATIWEAVWRLFR